MWLVLIACGFSRRLRREQGHRQCKIFRWCAIPSFDSKLQLERICVAVNWLIP